MTRYLIEHGSDPRWARLAVEDWDGEDRGERFPADAVEWLRDHHRLPANPADITPEQRRELVRQFHVVSDWQRKAYAQEEIVYERVKRGLQEAEAAGLGDEPGAGAEVPGALRYLELDAELKAMSELRRAITWYLGIEAPDA